MPDVIPGSTCLPKRFAGAKIGRPEGEFLVGHLADFPVRADLTICLDVLIHQADAGAYRDQVARLWESADQALVVSGYERPLGALGPMVHFHEPLSATLRTVAPDAEYYPVREEHGITTFVVLRPQPAPHPATYEPDHPLVRHRSAPRPATRCSRSESTGDVPSGSFPITSPGSGNTL